MNADAFLFLSLFTLIRRRHDLGYVLIFSYTRKTVIKELRLEAQEVQRDIATGRPT